MQYELFYLVGASQEADLEKIKKDVSEIVTSLGGVFSEKETMEKRRLAYKIKKDTHGIYVARRFEMAETENMQEISRKMNLHPNVLRFIISRAEELPELKSREERMQEETEKNAKRASEMKARPSAPEKREDVQTSEKKIEPKEDIDKKLEEILNI